MPTKQTDIRESDVEKYLVRRVEEHGGEVRKVRWIGRVAALDRVVFLNGVHFVEVKRPTVKVPSAHQAREMRRMDAHGASTHFVNSFAMVDDFIEEVTR